MEVVTGRDPEEEEKDGGGWVVVETQRKTREEPAREVESRTGRIQRLYPTLCTQCTVDSLARLEEEKGMREMLRVEEMERKYQKKLAARSARG